MAEQPKELTGPDLEAGIPAGDLVDGVPLPGHVGGEPVVLVRRGTMVFCLGATCTHYGGPLAEGLVVGNTLRCPWHHACFSLETGEAIGAPALNPVPRWTVVEQDGLLRVTDKLESGWPAVRPDRRPDRRPASVLIVGAGAAGAAAAEELRKQGYDGPVALIDPDPDAPCDRPNLSKDYLAGTAPEEWIPLHPAGFYATLDIELVRDRIVSLNPAGHSVRLAAGGTREYGALLLAPGAEPVRLDLPNDDSLSVLYLRTVADSRRIIDAARSGTRAVVLGASFIGLEVAASLRARGMEVHVAAPEERLFERVLGPELGDFVRNLHESKGVTFHLGRTARDLARGTVTLSDGSRLSADLVVAGVGVRPREELARAAGLRIDRGILVDRFLQAAPDVYAVGDAARYPDPMTGELIRIEHWVVAERQGQAAARNILGAGQPFTDVPFFWSAHYDAVIAYVGHAEQWDTAELSGDPAGLDCRVQYRLGGQVRAVATIFRDQESLEAEVALEALARTNAAERGAPPSA